MRGLETSGMTNNDKENIPVNKPFKKKGRPLGGKRNKQNGGSIVNSFFDQENKNVLKQQKNPDREPFQQIDDKPRDTALQELQLNQLEPSFDTKANQFESQNNLLTFHQHMQLHNQSNF